MQLVEADAEADSSQGAQNVTDVPYGRLHRTSPRSWLVDHDPEADGGHGADDMANVADGELHRSSPGRWLIHEHDEADCGEGADDVANVPDAELHGSPPLAWWSMVSADLLDSRVATSTIRSPADPAIGADPESAN